MNNTEFIGKYISFLYREGQKYLDRELEPYKIGSGQFYILMPLFEADGVNQESLSRTIRIDKASVTRSMQKLTDEGYVVRKKDTADSRSYQVFLTPKGRLIKDEILRIAAGWEEIMLQNFDNEKSIQVLNFLKEMTESVSEQAKV